MNIFKAAWKSKGSRVWFFVTVLLVILLLVVSILATTVFDNLLVPILGGPRRIIDKSAGVELLYKSEFTSKKEALAHANDLNIKINEEGMVLLKNNNSLPLAEKSKISVFGKNSVKLVYGGTGSGGFDASKGKTIYDSLDAAKFSYNKTLKEFYQDNKQSGSGRSSSPGLDGNYDSLVLSTGETQQSSYTQAVKNSYSNYNDAALVVFSRIGGESWDLPRMMGSAAGARNADDHYLQLDKNETDLLKAVCAPEAGFKHVIVLINSSNNMELGFLDDPDHYAYSPKIDGAIWIGCPGLSGIMALGKVLKGEVNPSGRMIDTSARDFKKDPVWQNFGENLVKDGDRYIRESTSKYATNAFVDYEEGIYVGYRYYETRGASGVTGGEGESWYNDNVVYPFGYGLSYSNFEWTLSNKSALNGTALTKAEINIEVKVKNLGPKPGKDVVQIYCAAPYAMNGIEKPYVVLCGFAKTKLLAVNAEQTLSIKIDPYDFASYDYSDANGNGFKGYELETGNYEFKISKNAHESVDSVTLSAAAGIKFDKDTISGKNSVENRFDDASEQLGSILSRADFAGTFPKTRTTAEKTVDNTFLEKLSSVTVNNPNTYNEMPTQGVAFVPEYDENGQQINAQVRLRTLIGKSYDDAQWDDLLDQLTVSEMLELYNKAAYQTVAIGSIGKPKTTSADGPVGFTIFMGNPEVYGTCGYASECVLAATWNIEMAFEMGKSIGNESLMGNEKGDGAPYSEWFAPGVNIHRSPFGGRNTEYYSEDSHVSGMMAAYVIKGAMSKGVSTFVKHFAVNDQETHRDFNGLATWLTEQTMREIYLRPFEKAVKLGGTRAVMSSFNRIGTVWAGGDYRLLTEVLRNEWGFNGTVICDFHVNSYMNSKQMAYAGGDLNLCTTTDRYWNLSSSPSATDITILRQATKNILYTVANSNAMNAEVIGYKLPIWTVWLIIVDVVIVVGLGAWGFFAIRKAIRKGK